LPEQGITDLWPALDIGPDSGIDRLEIRQGAQGDLLVLLEGEHSPDLNLELPISVVHHSPAGEFVLAGDDYLLMEVLKKSFHVSAGSFFQVNTQQAGAMVRHLQANLPLSSSATLLDVYCGVGLFSAFLAGSVHRCISLELSPSACQDFVENLDEFDHVELYEGAAEAVLPALDVKPDVVLVDPPRAGLAREALDAIVRMQPPVLAYVSCDPATLARDAKRLLAAGYMMDSITPFDLFPQTYHIETISLFRL
jgi:23S rRNA (uracil1939-C5)-methyltransferase